MPRLTTEGAVQFACRDLLLGGGDLRLLLLCPDRKAYAELCRIISNCRRRADKGQYQLEEWDLRSSKHCLALWLPQGEAEVDQYWGQLLSRHFSGRLHLALVRQLRYREARYLASGWELASESAFHAAVEHLSAAGIEYHSGTASEIEQRGVQALVKVSDPSGNVHELSWGHRSDCLPFVSPQGVPRFITGDMGLGHTVLPAPNLRPGPSHCWPWWVTASPSKACWWFM